MRGFVRKRGSTYTWYSDMPDPVTGKRKQHSRGGFRTKRECQEALNEALARLREGIFVRSSPRGLGTFLVDEWLPAVRPPRVRPSTWDSYRMAVERHIVPALGDVILQRLTPAHLTAFYRALVDDGRRDGRGGLAPKTVRNVHGVLHAAFRDAVRWGYLPRNVAAGADLPKGMAPEMHMWSPEQLRAFLEHVRPTRCMRSGCCSPPPACGMGRSPGCVGRTSTWKRHASRRAGHGWSSTTRSSSPSPRPPRAAGRWRLTRRRSPRCASTEPGSWSSGWRLARAGRTRAWCSPGPTAARSIAAVLEVVRAAHAGGRPTQDSVARRSPQLRDRGAGRRRPGQGGQRAAGDATIAITMDTYSHVLPGLDAQAAGTVPA
jgi:integrase